MNEDVVVEARTWIGVRWRHQGRDRDGLDCVGLPIVCALKLRGLKIPTNDYPRASTDNQMIEICRQYLEPVADMQPGDVVVLGFGRQRHMAIIGDYPSGGLSLIHAYLPNRKVVEQRLDDVWAGRILAAFRIPRAG